jgi:hypothetical protein
MQETYKAWLQGNQLEWISDAPVEGDSACQVEVIVLNQQATLNSEERGKKMAEILEKLAKTQGISEIEPLGWQAETRQDRLLPGR